VRFGNSRWMTTIARGEARGSVNLEGMTITRSGHTTRITMNDGASVCIVRVANYYNVNVALPHHYVGRTGGLCSNLGRGATFFMPGNRPTGNVQQFGNSWAVPPTDNIFACTGAKKCVGDVPLKVHGKFLECKIPVVPPVYKVLEIPKPAPAVATTNGVVPVTKLPPPFVPDPKEEAYDLGPDTGAAKVPPECEAKATKQCNIVLIHTVGNKVVPIGTRIKSCVFDYCIMKKITVVEGWKRQYYTLLAQYVKGITNTRGAPAPKMIEASKLAEELCLNGKCTPVCCKNGGKRTVNGCECKAPFTGPRCGKQVQ